MFDTTSPTAVLGLLLGGVMLLLYGVHLASEALRHAMGARLRMGMARLARYPLAAFGIGVVATGLTQSSGATSALLVGLINAQLVSLTTAIVMLLGANVGSTLVVQLLALHITDYAVVLSGLGAAFALFTMRTGLGDIGRTFFGFGLVLLGLAALQAGSAPIAASRITAELLLTLLGAPLVLAIIGAALAIIFASSAAAIGLLLVLVANGTLPLAPALALMLGANVGSTITALLAALSDNTIAGRRLALIHTGTKLSGAIAVLPLLGPLMMVLSALHLDAPAQVAVAHLGFNLLLAAVFAPLAIPLARLAEILLPDHSAYNAPGARYLDARALSKPAMALGLAVREVLRMTELVTEMLDLSIHAFEDGGVDVPARIDALDDELDSLNAEIKRYLTQLDEAMMTEEQVRREIALLYVITDLEEIGDLVDKQFMRLARRKRRTQAAFSDEGWEDLLAYHREVTAGLHQVLAALAAHDPSIVAEFPACKARLGRMKRELHLRHLQRLHSKVPPSLESSAIHLDLLDAMSRVLSHASNIAHAIQGDL